MDLWLGLVQNGLCVPRWTLRDAVGDAAPPKKLDARGPLKRGSFVVLFLGPLQLGARPAPFESLVGAEEAREHDPWKAGRLGGRLFGVLTAELAWVNTASKAALNRWIPKEPMVLRVLDERPGVEGICAEPFM